MTLVNAKNILHRDWVTPSAVAPGLYRVRGFNPQFLIGELRNLSFEQRYPEFPAVEFDSEEEFKQELLGGPITPSSDGSIPLRNCYGVVDSIPQFYKFFAEQLESDPRDFLVTFTPVYRRNQPAQGGWRYHKWGKYYGTQDPQHEYLYHDTHIDVVEVFHIYDISASPGKLEAGSDL